MRPSAGVAAAAAGLLASVPAVSGACTCKWTIATPLGTHWSGATGGSKVVPATSSDLCQEACCEDTGSIGCVAFTCVQPPRASATRVPAVPSSKPLRCAALAATIPAGCRTRSALCGRKCRLPRSGRPVRAPPAPPRSLAGRSSHAVRSQGTRRGRVGWTSGKLSAPSECNEAAKEAEDSWIFSVLFLVSLSGYCVGGIVVKKQQGRGGAGDWLPNHQFWASLYGLVIDGVGLVARGGKPAGYAEISAAVDAMAQEKAEGGGASRAVAAEKEVEDPVLASQQASRAQPTSLHSAATLGDLKKLEKLLKAAGCPAIDSGDSRRYTAFHVACAGGHLACETARELDIRRPDILCWCA